MSPSKQCERSSSDERKCLSSRNTPELLFSLSRSLCFSIVTKCCASFDSAHSEDRFGFSVKRKRRCGSCVNNAKNNVPSIVVWRDGGELVKIVIIIRVAGVLSAHFKNGQSSYSLASPIDFCDMNYIQLTEWVFILDLFLRNDRFVAQSAQTRGLVFWCR